jgi:hypothetical protein
MKKRQRGTILRVGECELQADGTYVISGWRFDCHDNIPVIEVTEKGPKVAGWWPKELYALAHAPNRRR